MKRSIYVLIVTLTPIILFSQDTIKIMPLGNSITQGENQGSDNYNSWRRQLFMQLQTIVLAPDTFDFIGSSNLAFPGVPFPDSDFDQDHEGHWGWRIDEIQGNLGSWIQLASVGPPDIVLMHLGSNDCFAIQSINSSVTELEAVIDTLRIYNPTVAIFLAQMIPTSRPADTLCIEELNDSIAVIAIRKDEPASPIILVDQNTGFSAATDTYDDIHPNLIGEMKMAAVWFTALEPFINTILPVELIHFSGDFSENQVTLHWKTGSEIDIENFTIERGETPLTFQSIGSISALGTRDIGKEYFFNDQPDLNGRNYYRLRINDLDGSHSYSPIIQVEGQKDRMVVYPNPVQIGQRIYLSEHAGATIKLTAPDGKTEANLYRSGDAFEIPRLRAGLYYLQGETIDRREWTEKIIIYH